MPNAPSSAARPRSSPISIKPGDYDLAGFCVGVVEREHIIDGRAIQTGDVVLGLASTGLHSNGYSLARKIVFEHAGLNATDFVAELGRTVGEELLTPTRIYVRAIKNILEHYPIKKRVVRGLAHITGEGLPGNVPRVLPPGKRVFLKRGSWPIPPVFTWLQKLGDIDEAEMAKVFNLGIGFVMIVSPYFADSIQRQTLRRRRAHLRHRRRARRRGGCGMVLRALANRTRLCYDGLRMERS